MFLWYGVYLHPILLLRLQRPLPDACGFAQAVLGCPFGVPSKYTPKNDMTPPLFLRGLYPLPFGGVARDCFSRQIKRLLFFNLAASPNRPWIPVREIREKVQKKAVFWGPQDPGKGVFFGLCHGSLKPAIAGFMARNPLKVSIGTFNGDKKKRLGRRHTP